MRQVMMIVVTVVFVFTVLPDIGWSGGKPQGYADSFQSVPVAVKVEPPAYYVYANEPVATPYSGLEVITLLLGVIGAFLGGAALAEAKTARREVDEAKALNDQLRRLIEQHK